MTAELLEERRRAREAEAEAAACRMKVEKELLAQQHTDLSAITGSHPCWCVSQAKLMEQQLALFVDVANAASEVAIVDAKEFLRVRNGPSHLARSSRNCQELWRVTVLSGVLSASYVVRQPISVIPESGLQPRILEDPCKLTLSVASGAAETCHSRGEVGRNGPYWRLPRRPAAHFPSQDRGHAAVSTHEPSMLFGLTRATWPGGRQQSLRRKTGATTRSRRRGKLRNMPS